MGRDEGYGKWVEPADLPTPRMIVRAEFAQLLFCMFTFPVTLIAARI